MSIYEEIAEARRTAPSTGAIDDLDALPGDDPRWLATLTERIDQLEQQVPVGRRAAESPPSAPSHSPHHRPVLREELLRIAAIAAAWADKLGQACDHYGFVRSFRNRAIGGGSGAFEIRERVMCTRCGESFGDHMGRP